MNTFHEVALSQLKHNIFEDIGSNWMLISANKDGITNTMTASWGGFGVLWKKPVAFIFVRPQRYTKSFLDSANYFSLTFFDKHEKTNLSYLGKVSGKDEDKIKNVGYHIINQENAPYFQEAKQVFICRKLYCQELTPESFIDKTCMENNYPLKDYHFLYVGEITKVLESD